MEGGLAVVGLLAAASMCLPVLAGLVRQWYEDSNAAYGLFVAAAAAVVTRRRWPQLRALPIHGSAWGGGALGAGAALYVAGTLAADVFLLRLSTVALVAGALWVLCGTAHVRTLGPALVLAAAAIPLPGAVVTELTMPLQLAASKMAAGVLGATGFEVVRAGNVLTLSHITLEVAEACSGMRSLVSLLALVAVYWGMAGAPVRHVVILIAATLPVALAGNALRVVATAMLATRIGEDAARGFVHDATGFAAFLLMAVLLLGVHVIAARCVRRRAGSPHELEHRAAGV